MSHTPGPCETLARLAIQSQWYQVDADFRDAVDAVLGHPVYDAAPALLEVLTRFVNGHHSPDTYEALMADARAILRAVEERKP